MKGAVTNRQIFFLLLMVLVTFSIMSLPKNAVLAAGTGSWVTFLLLTVIFIFGVYVITSLNKKFINKTIFEYSKLLVGNAGSYLISIFYALYFLFVLIILSHNIADTIKEAFLPETPVYALLLLFYVVCAFIGSKGITNIARFCEIIGFFYIITSLSIHFTMFILGDNIYLFPLFETAKVKDYIFGIKDLFVPFLGIEILTIIPFGKINIKSGRRTAVFAIMYVGFFYIFMVESSISVLGINNAAYYDAALIEALRETHIPPTFLLERPDLLFLIVGTAGLIAEISIVIFSTREFVSKITSQKYKLTIFFIIVFSYILSVLLTDKFMKFLFEVVLPVVGIFTAFIIPLTLLIIAKVKRYEKV